MGQTLGDCGGTRQWCPAEDPRAPSTEVHELPVEESVLRLQSFVRFHRLGFVSTVDEPEARFPSTPANSYVMRDLLRLAGLNASHLRSNGALLDVAYVFACNLDDSMCESKAEIFNV